MTACVLGIDPGGKGAIAVLDLGGDLLVVYDMPATIEANGRSATNAALLSLIIAHPFEGYTPSHIFCEFVAARPTDAKVAAFAFGRARGVIEGVAGAFDINVTFLTPPTWKRFAGVPPGKENKDVARTKAIARWPDKASLFTRKRDCDRADASLIGAAGLILYPGAIVKRVAA
jgi:crossover junction endodeoxyribonuclease RuvC